VIQKGKSPRDPRDADADADADADRMGDERGPRSAP
jgi:hypothetical protein